MGQQRGHIPPGMANRFLQGNSFGINLRYISAISNGIEGTGLPFIKDEPRLFSDLMGVDLVFHFPGERVQHYLRTSLALPSGVYANTGSEASLQPDRQRSVYSRQQQLYYFNIPLSPDRFFRLWYGFSAQIKYESRAVYYQLGGWEKKWEAGFGLGPNMAVNIPIGERIGIRGEAHFPVVLPHASMGMFSAGATPSMEKETAFSMMAILPFADISSRILLADRFFMQLGYRYTLQMGYGNPGISFARRNIITHSYEGIHEFYISMAYRHHGRWTRRKYIPACRTTEYQ